MVPGKVKAKLSRMWKFVWNSETRELFGRNGASWGKIILFYITFYFCLASFSAMMLMIFYCTVDPHKPRYTDILNPKGSSSGNTKEGSSRSKRHALNEDMTFFTDDLDNFLDNIETSLKKAEDSVINCSLSTTHHDFKDGKVCKIDLFSLSECTRDNHFGHKHAKPCVVIQMNKINGWTPLGYGVDSTGEADWKLLEHDLMNTPMPASLQQLIKDTYQKYKFDNHMLTMALNSAWVSCESAKGQDDIVPISYTPMQGFPSYYFPFRNQRGYQSPIVMVQFSQLQKGQEATVECNIWAKNIETQHKIILTFTSD